MSLNEEDYWPAEMVNELKTLVRKEKFNWNSVSEKLTAWLASDSMQASEKSSFDISPKTCREAFARDYSKAPYNLDKKTSPMKQTVEPSEEVKSQSSPSRVVELSAEDEEEASKFDFDMPGEDSSVKVAIQTVEKIEPLPVTPGPDLTYEEVLENAERIEEENYRRKEEVFKKVAKLLMLDGFGDGDGEGEGDGEESSDIKPMNAMDAQVIRAFQEGRRKRQEEKSKRKKQQADAEEWRKIKEDRERLRRRFDEGSEDAEGEAYSFSPGANNSKGSTGSDSQTNEEAEKALYEHYVRSMIGAAGAPSSSSAASDLASGSKAMQAASDSKKQVHQEVYRQLIVDTIAAKYHNELSAVRDGTGAGAGVVAEASSAEGASLSPSSSPAKPEKKSQSSAAVNLSGGFLESDEFEEILTSLEAEQAATAQQKGGERGGADDEGSSDLADVLAILDAAAAGQGTGAAGGKASEDDGVAAMMREMASMEPPYAAPRGPASGKVLLRAGMGAARRPGDVEEEPAAAMDMPPPPPKQTSGGRMGTSTLQESKGAGGRAMGASRGPRAMAMGRGGSREEDDDDEGGSDEDDDDDADSNWKSRRAAAKAKAAKAPGPAAGGAVGAGSSGVYGFGGAGGAMQGRPKRAAGGSGVSIERSSDKAMPLSVPVSVSASVPAAVEESKGEVPPAPPASGTPQSQAATESASAPRSGSSTASSKSLTPDLGGTWSDVLTPPTAATGAGGAGAGGVNLASEVDAEAAAEDIAPVQVGAAVSVSSVGGGMLGGRSGGSRSKAKTPMAKRK